MAERRPLVLVDGRLERRRRTGVATVIRETRAAMAADPPADLRVRWLSGPAGLPRRGRITTAANLALDLVWLHALIPLAAWRQKADLVHAPVNWTPWWCPCPTVVTVQDLSFERLPDAYPAGFRRYASLFARRSARRARRVIATSQAGARDLGELYRVPRERIRVVPLGCRVDREPDRDREPFILCVGEFEPRKRVLHLLAAHKRYFTSAPTDPPVCRLVLAGSGGSEEQAVRRAAHPGVDVLGFVDEDDLAELYRRATLFVSVSAYEGFGLPIAEAMGHGCPVLVAANSAQPEVAGAAGLVIEGEGVEAIERALTAALADRAALAARGRAGRERAAELDWAGSARGTLEVYREALSGSL
ncbi:MAG: glycosyltransferase family 4 protein [Thermoleophilia bacterium]|jgi:glycosyltransferase involved in cell wall biosynthesis|nr:glycosyltransferase family 4 protein [Thermoleophilia bacterium]